MSTLATELSTDPLGRGYSGMTDQQAADDLNTAYRDSPLDSISGDQAFSVTDNGEFTALTDLKKQLWLSFCSRASIDPFGSANVAFVQWVFGGGATTVASLNTLRSNANGRTRAEELNAQDSSVPAKVGAGDVAQARA